MQPIALIPQNAARIIEVARHQGSINKTLLFLGYDPRRVKRDASTLTAYLFFQNFEQKWFLELLAAPARRRKSDAALKLSNEENFSSALKQASSFKHLLNLLGLPASNRNRTLCKEKMKLINSSVSFASPRKMTFETIFCEKSTASRSTAKAWILSRNGNHPYPIYKCAHCPNDGTWNGKPSRLALEHENGVANDNRLENLKFLCANCHSQTETFARRKKTYFFPNLDQ